MFLYKKFITTMLLTVLAVFAPAILPYATSAVLDPYLGGQYNEIGNYIPHTFTIAVGIISAIIGLVVAALAIEHLINLKESVIVSFLDRFKAQDVETDNIPNRGDWSA